MPFPWAAAAGVIASAASAYLDHLKSRADADQRARDRRTILQAVQTATDELLTAMLTATITELKGELEGFQSTYAAYDADPGDPVEENRLARLIDDSARTAGRLGAIADDVDGNPQLALESWPIYLSVVYLRAQAMTERQVTFGASELKDALPSFDSALMRIDGLLSHLRKQSDRRFGPIRGRLIGNPPSIVIIFYSFLNTQIVCGTPTAADPRKCERTRARHMDAAFDSIEGVRQLRAVSAELRDVRDALDTFSVLDLLTPHDLHELGFDPNSIRAVRHGQLELPTAGIQENVT